MATTIPGPMVGKAAGLFRSGGAERQPHRGDFVPREVGLHQASPVHPDPILLRLIANVGCVRTVWR